MKNFAWIKEKFRGFEKARKLQAKEYKRRLADLNHEAAQLKDMQSTYVTKEVFDKTIDNFNDKLNIVNQWINKQEGKSDLTKYIPWIISAIALYLLYIRK